MLLVSCFWSERSPLFFHTVHVEPELLHTYSKVYKSDVILLIVRLAVLTAVTLTVPVVLFPVSVNRKAISDYYWHKHLAAHVE